MDNPFFVNGAHWAMKKRQLPELRQGPFDYGVGVWRGPHPSPEFKHVMVWWTRRADMNALSNSLASLFKKAYSSSIQDLLPKVKPWPR